MLEGGEKVTLEAHIPATAREIVAGEDLIRKPVRFRTLYLGLKLNHPSNVAIVHPMMFTLRRIAYALAIVLLQNVKVVSTWILLFGTVAMVVFSITTS